MPSVDDLRARQAELSAAVAAGDRAAYYGILADLGIRYSLLVMGSFGAGALGRVAIAYMENYWEDLGRTGPCPTEEISLALMEADWKARQDALKDSHTDLDWKTIRDYHATTLLEVAQLPPEVWTAYIPLMKSDFWLNKGCGR